MSEVLQLRWLDIQQSIRGGVGGRGFPVGAGVSQRAEGVGGEAKAGAADCQLQWRSSEAGADPICPLPPRIIPLYLIYRPANNIPYATMEEDLGGPCVQYCVTERDGSLVTRGTSEVVLKCCTFQHWVYQWTNGNILVTDMEGKGTSLPSGS